VKPDFVKYKFCLRILFFAYFIIACWLLFFQLGGTERASYFTSRKIHFIPFESTFHSIKLALTNNFGAPHKFHYRYITIRNIIGNIFLFLPFGLLAPMLFYKIRSIKKVFFSAAVISVCVETIQFVLVVGVADIDDVLLNILGALIGFYLFLFFRKKIKTGGIGANSIINSGVS
jgi:glycopeptide antibiotics resistance protein